MSTEIATYLQELQWVLDQIAYTLRSYPSGKLDWRPLAAAANSASAIASHVVSSTRVYVLGFGCGQAVSRERAAEFAAAGRDTQELMSLIQTLSAEISAALTALPPAAAEARYVGPLGSVIALHQPCLTAPRLTVSPVHAIVFLAELNNHSQEVTSADHCGR